VNYEAKKIIEYLKRFDFSKGERPVILEEEYKNLVSYVERLNNIINKALEKSKGLQYRFGYVLDDLIYLLMQGSDKE